MTHSFPTRRSSDRRRAGGDAAAERWADRLVRQGTMTDRSAHRVCRCVIDNFFRRIHRSTSFFPRRQGMRALNPLGVKFVHAFSVLQRIAMSFLTKIVSSMVPPPSTPQEQRAEKRRPDKRVVGKHSTGKI